MYNFFNFFQEWKKFAEKPKLKKNIFFWAKMCERWYFFIDNS